MSYKQHRLIEKTAKIVLDVSKGDTVLMGRFKNMKVVVKKIGKDDYGMPTINGKKAVTFRYAKEEEKTAMLSTKTVKGIISRAYKKLAKGVYGSSSDVRRKQIGDISKWNRERIKEEALKDRVAKMLRGEK